MSYYSGGLGWVETCTIVGGWLGGNTLGTYHSGGLVGWKHIGNVL